MPNDRRTQSLPVTEAFWSAVDNDPTREYYNTCVIELIRNAKPQNEIERIELLAQLKLMVDLLDSPKSTYSALAISAIEEQERLEAESVL